MDFLEYSWVQDWYEKIAEELPAVTDYFDFPSTMLAFAESFPDSSRLTSLDNQAYFRLRGKQLTLITYFCEPWMLEGYIRWFTVNDYKVKTINFAHKPMLDSIKPVSYGKEWYALPSWSLEDVAKLHDSKSNWRLRKAVRYGEENYTITPMSREQQEDFWDVQSMFNRWVDDAKKRHFMVVQGHYWAYIRRYWAYGNNVRLMLVRRNSDNELMGIFAYEVFRGFAQTTLCKLLRPDGFHDFNKYVWVELIQYMLAEGVTKAFCGSTADDLKSYLGLQFDKSYKPWAGVYKWQSTE